ncbi:hypothetical protein TNCV_4339991 [Trichonephila clavipes]|nr:hypothetical protein TNCV_4339991 [Trichonephila clavipes]
MSRFGRLSERDLQCLRPQASLVLIYRSIVAGMKGRADLVEPLIEPKTCSVEARYTTRPIRMSRFSTRSDFQRAFLIWRDRDPVLSVTSRKEHRYVGFGVLVWGGIMLNGRTELHIFDRGSVIGFAIVRYFFPMCACSEVPLAQTSFLWITMHGHIGL